MSLADRGIEKGEPLNWGWGVLENRNESLWREKKKKNEAKDWSLKFPPHQMANEVDQYSVGKKKIIKQDPMPQAT